MNSSGVIIASNTFTFRRAISASPTLRTCAFTDRPSIWFGSCESFGLMQNTYHDCVSSSVSNSTSSAERNSPATHGAPPDAAGSSSSRSFSSTSPLSFSVGMRLIVFFRRVDGARMGLTGCCAETIVSSLRGCAWVAMAFAEKRPRTKGFMEPEPSAAGASVVPALVPRRSDTKSGLSASRFFSRKPCAEYVTGPL